MIEYNRYDRIQHEWSDKQALLMESGLMDGWIAETRRNTKLIYHERLNRILNSAEALRSSGMTTASKTVCLASHSSVCWLEFSGIWYLSLIVTPTRLVPSFLSLTDTQLIDRLVGSIEICLFSLFVYWHIIDWPIDWFYWDLLLFAMTETPLIDWLIGYIEICSFFLFNDWHAIARLSRDFALKSQFLSQSTKKEQQQQSKKAKRRTTTTKTINIKKRKLKLPPLC